MADWTNKTALVTGAGSGIGRAMATTLAARGARVVLSDIDAAALEKAGTGLPGDGHLAVPCDVADPTAVDALFERAVAEIGVPDLVAANAGVSCFGTLVDQPLEDIHWQFNVNVFGCLHVARAGVAAMRTAGRPGHLLLTGSENSLSLPSAVAGLQIGAYNATKHAVLSFAEVLRVELEPEGIGVSLLCPGPTPSRLMSGIRRRDEAHGGPREVPRLDVPPEVLETLAGQNIDTEAVGAMAIDGVEARQFYILTHPHMQDDVESRYREILAAFTATSPA